MPKILITGASGFIGSHLLKHLGEHHEVVFLSRRPISLSGMGIEWLEQDLCDPLDFSNLPGKIDVVLHLAQSRFYRQFPDKAGDIFNVNVQGTFRLLEYARYAKAHCFVFASTGSVYGYSLKKFLETDPAKPIDFYGISKCMGESLIRAYEPFFRNVILRFFTVYGPGEEKMLIPSLLEKIRSGKTVAIEGESGFRINPIFVKDAVSAIESALHQPVSGIFNVAGDEVVTIRDLIGLIEKAVDRKALIQHKKTFRPGDLIGDNARMKEVLNAYPVTRLRKGLKKMVQG